MITDLIIPAFNEEQTIGKLIEQITAQQKQTPENKLFRNIWVVDNNSTDRTKQIAKQAGAKVVCQSIRGYGAACLKGIDHVRIENQNNPALAAQAVAFLDADLSDDWAYLEKLIQKLVTEKCDMIIGSRVKNAQARSLSTIQKFGNALSCHLIKLCTGKRFSDLGPMRIVRWEALEKMKMKDQTWGWTVEMQYKAAALGLKCSEVDVPYRMRGGGKSKISGTLLGSAKAGYKILTTIAKLRLTLKHIKSKNP